jgi:hypothetical protein
MRTLKKKTIVPEEIIEAHEEETTAYGCDFCDFESEDEDGVKLHHGQEHAAKDTKEIGGHTFVRFETEADMDAWADAQCSPHGTYDETNIRWSGQGWYAVSGKSVRCSRGCCTNYALCLETASSLAYSLEREIAHKEAELEEIRRELLPDEQ